MMSALYVLSIIIHEHANSSIQALQLIFNKLRRSMNPGAILDPFQYLPLEIAEMVLHHLQMRDRVYAV